MQLKERVVVLTKQKEKLKAAMIDSQEEKVKLSEQLIDLSRENKQLKYQHEEDKFKMNQQVLEFA